MSADDTPPLVPMSADQVTIVILNWNRGEETAACLDSLAQAAGHADRRIPFQSYCTGLLLPGERKSVEPMAARLAPDSVRRMHQSLHHFVADAPWSDEAMLDRA